MPKTVDPITAQVVNNAVLAIAEEMGAVLIRTAYSSNIKERKDCSCAIFDANGSVVAQAEHQPIHLGSMLGIIEHITRRYPREEMRPGDLFITNDPYSGGGSHLPDITVASPVFADGVLIGFVANIGHHADRRTVGTTVYDEGFRIPPVRLFEGGVLREDVLDIILQNFQLRRERLGDLRAQFGANRLGAERLEGVARHYGTEVLQRSFEHALDYARRRITRAIPSVPPGTYSFEDYVERSTTPHIKIGVTITVESDKMSFDFSGSDGQVEEPLNLPYNALRASVYYAVKALLAPTIPPNAGYFSALDIVAPQGSVVNPVEPAPVMDRSETSQRVVDVIIGALSDVLKERAIAACHGTNTAIIFMGERESGEPYVYMETFGGGFGARADSDGPDALQVHMINTSNLPVEALEAEYPLRVNRYALAENSGGAGQFRGGRGLVREIEILSDGALLTGHSDRQDIPPWGLFGGQPGAPGAFYLNNSRLASKFSDVAAEKGDVIRIVTPGGGGYGPRELRSSTMPGDEAV